MKGDTRTVEEIAEEIANQKLAQYEAKMDKMAKERQELDRRTQQKAQEESIKTEIQTAKNQIKELYEADKDKFEFINSTPGAIDVVWDTIQEYFNESNKVPKYEDILEAVEESLETDFYERSKSSKKLQARMEKDKAEQAAKAQELLASSAKYDKYGRNIQDPKPKAVEKAVETTPEPKPVEVAANAHIKSSKKVGILETLRQVQERAKGRLDN